MESNLFTIEVVFFKLWDVRSKSVSRNPELSHRENAPWFSFQNNIIRLYVVTAGLIWVSNGRCFSLYPTALTYRLEIFGILCFYIVTILTFYWAFFPQSFPWGIKDREGFCVVLFLFCNVKLPMVRLNGLLLWMAWVTMQAVRWCWKLFTEVSLVHLLGQPWIPFLNIILTAFF